MELSLMSFSMMTDCLFRKMDAGKLCEIAKQNHLKSMDMMSFEMKMYGEEKMAPAMKAAGIRCGCIIMSPAFFTGQDKVEGEIKEALEQCRRLGSKYLMIVPGHGTAKEEKICRKMTRQQILDIAVEKYKLAVKLARDYDIQIGFENTPQAFKPLASPEDCKYLLEQVEGLGFIFDTGNFKVADTACDELEIYEMLKSYIIRVHLKDVVVGRFKSGEGCVDGQKIRAVTTGSGVIPMEELIHRLQRDGYQGDLAIEYASPADVHGLDNSEMLRPYCTFIRGALQDGVVRPPYTRIKNISQPVSKIFFGTAIMPMLMGKNVEGLLDGILSTGINAFDCARGYGKAEKSLGSWMKERNNRERVVILTKCGNVSMGGKVNVNRQVIEKELEASLKALQTDYIDIYLLHRDDPSTPVSEFIDCLNEAKEAGKIRTFGVSNWTMERIVEANAYAASRGLQGFAVSSPNFGLAEQLEDPWGGGCVTISGESNGAVRDWYAKEQMPVIAYSSLGRGFFSGKFKSGDMEGAKQVLDGPAQKGYLCEENMQRLKRAEELAKRDNCSIPQIAMGYIFGSNMNVFAIVSTTKPSRMAENIEAARHPLSERDVQYLEGK